MKLQNNYDVGIYCRLSRDDNNGNLESMSIGNQKQILADYVKEKGWSLRDIYIDDGYSGTTFDRPDFKRMIRDVECGKIDCIITKDLSRLGRNYVKTGYYTEEYFAEKNVRYIAVNDSIDTMHSNNDIAPFQNILNEWYPKDISKKVRQVKKTSARQGKFMGSKSPYGYVKSPSDKHNLIVDDEAARIIKRIFNEFAHGDNGRQIANRLNDENVDSPRAYHYKCIGQENPNPNESNTWCSNTILQLLKNPVYIGNMVQGKRQVVSFKSKRREFTEPEDWIIVENTHEALIDIDVWESVQKCLKVKKKVRTNSQAEISLFAGVLRCSNCGGSLSFSAKRLAHSVKYIYKCGTYANHGKSVCTPHYVLESTLSEIVMNDIKMYATIAANDERILTKKLLSSANEDQEKELQFYKSKIREQKNHISVIDNNMKKLFEQKCAGNMSDNVFKTLLSDYDKEKSLLENKIPEMLTTLSTLENTTQDVTKWLALIKKYIKIESLDRNTVVELIDTITVSEPYEQDGEKHQTIEIKYKFVGCLNLEKNESIA